MKLLEQSDATGPALTDNREVVHGLVELNSRFLTTATFLRCHIPLVASSWSTMDHPGAVDAEDELGPLAHLAPSPQSEAVAHEFQELSLQSSQHLPPLDERKNGECVHLCVATLSLNTLFLSSVLWLPLP